MTIKTISDEEYIVSDVICNQYYNEHYFYYSEMEAIELFKEKFKDLYKLEEQG